MRFFIALFCFSFVVLHLNKKRVYFRRLFRSAFQPRLLKCIYFFVFSNIAILQIIFYNCKKQYLYRIKNSYGKVVVFWRLNHDTKRDQSPSLKKTREVGEESIRTKLLNIAATLDDVILLGRGDPDLATPSHIVEAAKQAIDHGATHYTHVRGNIDLRRHIGEVVNR